MWRPDNWENPNKVRPNNPSTASILRHSDYEKGADAMLEGLRPYLLMSLGNLMRLEPIVENSWGAEDVIWLKGLIDTLNEVTRR